MNSSVFLALPEEQLLLSTEVSLVYELGLEEYAKAEPKLLLGDRLIKSSRNSVITVFVNNIFTRLELSKECATSFEGLYGPV